MEIKSHPSPSTCYSEESEF